MTTLRCSGALRAPKDRRSETAAPEVPVTIFCNPSRSAAVSTVPQEFIANVTPPFLPHLLVFCAYGSFHPSRLFAIFRNPPCGHRRAVVASLVLQTFLPLTVSTGPPDGFPLLTHHLLCIDSAATEIFAHRTRHIVGV